MGLGATFCSSSTAISRTEKQHGGLAPHGSARLHPSPFPPQARRVSAVPLRCIRERKGTTRARKRGCGVPARPAASRLPRESSLQAGRRASGTPHFPCGFAGTNQPRPKAVTASRLLQEQRSQDRRLCAKDPRRAGAWQCHHARFRASAPRALHKRDSARPPLAAAPPLSLFCPARGRVPQRSGTKKAGD